MDRTVVVGMSGSTGLAVVRALAREGVACHAIHYDGARPAMSSRLARRHVTPDWREEPDALVDFLIELAAEIPTPASLFVCDDAALHAVWAADARLRAAGLRPAFSSRRPLADLLDKRTQLEAAARSGVDAPWTRWGQPAELAELAGDCPYPAILKPAFSHLGVRALGAKALRCASAEEARRALEGVGAVEVLLQEYVPGGDDQLYTAGVFVCGQGHLAFTGRKLKQHPPALGIARLAEAVDEPGLVPGSVALLAELGYEGVSQVEYKRDARDGAYRLMEANFRPWTWLGLATACGVNLPLAAHRWALGAGAPVAAGAGRSEWTDTLEGRPARWVCLVPEAAYTLRDLRRGVRPRVGQWRGLRAEAFFSRDDPMPLLGVMTAGVTALMTRWLLRERSGEGADTAGPHEPHGHGEPPWPARAGRTWSLRRVAHTALLGPAAVTSAAVLWMEWRRAGRRSVTGASPVVGLPAAGSALVLAPHPDDETLMCGATLAMLRRRGDDVRVVGITAGAATAVNLSAGAKATAAGASSDIGAIRGAELRSACAVLGVRDVTLWDFSDGALPAERGRLAERIREELRALQPSAVFVPLPYDAHADHVAAALALADALATGPGQAEDGEGPLPRPRILCAAVRMPFSPGWPTLLVPAETAWRARGAALDAYVSRGRALFATATQLARLHPARLFRATEGFVEMTVAGYVEFARAMESEGLTRPHMRGGGHPLYMGPKLVCTRGQRDRVAGLLRAVSARR